MTGAKPLQVQAHKQDEVYIVASGSAVFVSERGNRPVALGDAIIVAAGEQDKFIDIAKGFSTSVFFYDPDGGE